MKFNYKFNNLLGNVYKKGNIIFSSDGNTVVSPVGNKINVFDLKNNKATTLPVESRFNYTALDLSPNGCTLIAVNEDGEAHMISLVSQTIVHKYRFKGTVCQVKFSPNGKRFAACKDNNVFVFKVPVFFTGHNGFVMERVFHGANDETTCLSWSYDSNILAVGSRDMATKLYPLDKWENFRIFSLGNHTDSIVGCFFEENTYDIITISRNGQTCVWECTLNPGDLLAISSKPPPKKKHKKDTVLEEDEIDESKLLEKETVELSKALDDITMEEEVAKSNQQENKFFYKRIARHYLADEVRKENREAVLTCADYHNKTKNLITGFSNGSFFIHEAPDMNLIHSLNVSNQKITTACFNNTGDWIGLGCSDLGQLLVWEWQSETYVMKQQSHTNNICSLTYSTNGELLVTGGEDGKVKLWNVGSGFSFATFNEHSNAVSAVAFSGNKKFLVSASLDGTVRAYDVARYRNFRTFTSPRPVQFVCLAVDSSGEFVAAGGQDIFEIYLWSVKNGKLLEILSGHEGPVSSLAFNPLSTSTELASVSWDKTLKIWNAIEKGSDHETIELTSDGLCVAYKPNGKEIAAATLDGQICLFDVKTSTQIISIEGRNDLGSGRTDTDLVTAKKSLQAKAFTSICYTADGECLLAGGQSKNVCIYNVKEGLLIKKFEITQNRSLDAVDDFINRRKLTEFGNTALVEEREDREGGNVFLKLPGVRKGDMASRTFKPEVRVFSLQFSPTGQQWAAATTEGVVVYSLSSNFLFDPWNLMIGITPAAVRSALSSRDYSNALMMSMKLNEFDLILEVMEAIPPKDVELIVSYLSEQYVERLLNIIARALDDSRHMEFYLNWVQYILTVHGPKIKPETNTPAFVSLEKVIFRKCQQLTKLCDYNKYTIQYILTAGEVHKKREIKNDMDTSPQESEDEELFFQETVS